LNEEIVLSLTIKFSLSRFQSKRMDDQRCTLKVETGSIKPAVQSKKQQEKTKQKPIGDILEMIGQHHKPGGNTFLPGLMPSKNSEVLKQLSKASVNGEQVKFLNLSNFCHD